MISLSSEPLCCIWFWLPKFVTFDLFKAAFDKVISEGLISKRITIPARPKEINIELEFPSKFRSCVEQFLWDFSTKNNFPLDMSCYDGIEKVQFHCQPQMQHAGDICPIIDASTENVKVI